jgi:hypothetical protein
MLGAFAKNGSFGLLDVFIRFTTLNMRCQKKKIARKQMLVWLEYCPKIQLNHHFHHEGW